jgi:hypothetical protein
VENKNTSLFTLFWEKSVRFSVFTHGGHFLRGFTRAAGGLPAGKEQDVLLKNHEKSRLLMVSEKPVRGVEEKFWRKRQLRIFCHL